MGLNERGMSLLSGNGKVHWHEDVSDFRIPRGRREGRGELEAQGRDSTMAFRHGEQGSELAD